MRIKLRSIILALIFCGSITCLLNPKSLEAGTIHALLVADSLDQTIGDDTIFDLYNMEMMLQKASTHTGMKKVITVVKGDQATTENILEFLNYITVETDDVLFLYFSMHGYRTPSKTNQWPNLYFGQDGKGIDLNYIVEFSKQKMPRLLISIADVCNNEMEDGLVPLVKHRMAKSIFRAVDHHTAENYKKLFLYPSGTITISGSIPGEYSWSLKGKGGAYTLSFLSNLESTVQTSAHASWSGVLSKTFYNLEFSTRKSNTPGQHSQYVIELK